MSKVYFDVDAYTARLIGRENVSRLEGAVSELVKNTYDADANCCILYYENSTQTLYLADNGCGMTSDIIKKHWMTIGNSSKKKTYLSKKGRIQTGAKGIGRFALDRIGDRCTMYTVNTKCIHVPAERSSYLWHAQKTAAVHPAAAISASGQTERGRAAIPPEQTSERENLSDARFTAKRRKKSANVCVRLQTILTPAPMSPHAP